MACDATCRRKTCRGARSTSHSDTGSAPAADDLSEQGDLPEMLGWASKGRSRSPPGATNPGPKTEGQPPSKELGAAGKCVSRTAFAPAQSSPDIRAGTSGPQSANFAAS